MLSLIGSGLNLKDLTLKGLEEIKRSEYVFLEVYTSKIPDLTKNKLERIINKEIKILKREDLEQNSQKFLKKSKKNKVALIIPGDPLIATTHIELILEAKKKNIKTKIIHAPSIFTAAIGEAGLQLYKFGQPFSVSFPEKGFVPEAVYDVIKENKKRGLHTLLLLDIKSKKKKYMRPDEALNILLKIEEKRKEKVISKDMLVIALSKIGHKEQKILVKKAKEMINKNFENPPYTLIIPGKLHFKEKEYLATLS